MSAELLAAADICKSGAARFFRRKLHKHVQCYNRALGHTWEGERWIHTSWSPNKTEKTNNISRTNVTFEHRARTIAAVFCNTAMWEDMWCIFLCTSVLSELQVLQLNVSLQESMRQIKFFYLCGKNNSISPNGGHVAIIRFIPSTLLYRQPGYNKSSLQGAKSSNVLSVVRVRDHFHIIYIS